MNKCMDTEIQEMLPDLLHGSLDDQARLQVETHLSTCESCREELDVIRTVKSAAVFAPTIDIARVVSQIPPYRTIVPGVEAPARTRIVSWLVAAGLVVALVGGGSVVMLRQNSATSVVAKSAPDSNIGARTVTPVVTMPTPPKTTDVASAETHPHALALASNIDELNDGNLVQLMNDMDEFDALPAAEPEPVMAVDTGDSL